jgi:hypothetical protein
VRNKPNSSRAGRLGPVDYAKQTQFRRPAWPRRSRTRETKPIDEGYRAKQSQSVAARGTSKADSRMDRSGPGPKCSRRRRQMCETKPIGQARSRYGRRPSRSAPAGAPGPKRAKQSQFRGLVRNRATVRASGSGKAGGFAQALPMTQRQNHRQAPKTALAAATCPLSSRKAVS